MLISKLLFLTLHLQYIDEVANEYIVSWPEDVACDDLPSTLTNTQLKQLCAVMYQAFPLQHIKPKIPPATVWNEANTPLMCTVDLLSIPHPYSPENRLLFYYLISY